MQNRESESSDNVRFPFTEARQAVIWFRTYQPLAVRAINLIEHERAPQSRLRDMGFEPLDVHAAIAISLSKVERGIRDALSADVFHYHIRGEDNEGERVVYSAQWLAEYTGRGVATIYRRINNIYDDIYFELRRRELIPKRED